ncbi:MAG TPA: response regulator transcription factor [Oscillospiraceae bacterium]|nr:response regulator transcription factor [Oscillospiraceae bacterium]
MTRILLTDDDARIRTIVREYSQAEDWTFVEAGDGEEALKKFASGSFSLVLLDVMMPKLDGWSVLRQIRKTSTVPVILLTARNEEYDRLLGFELGVDDYIGKPFSPRELVARMKALLKRSGAHAAAGEAYVYEGLRVDPAARTVQIDGEAASLTPKEFDLLAYFVSRPGVAFTRDQLLNHVWGYDFFGDARTVDTHVKSLRDKLGRYRELIVTVWGTGYRFTGGEA